VPPRTQQRLHLEHCAAGAVQGLGGIPQAFPACGRPLGLWHGFKEFKCPERQRQVVTEAVHQLVEPFDRGGGVYEAGTLGLRTGEDVEKLLSQWGSLRRIEVADRGTQVGAEVYQIDG